ncbi:hypothetical protein Pve01_12090 [Planomonospora venezuelensis]|nr:hypothetical protein Pve01_12090 [Planomonospora venezuelensis]
MARAHSRMARLSDLLVTRRVIRRGVNPGSGMRGIYCALLLSYHRPNLSIPPRPT